MHTSDAMRCQKQVLEKALVLTEGRATRGYRITDPYATYNVRRYCLRQFHSHAARYAAHMY